MAYRMICKDSIEEKILDMQAGKKKLADSLPEIAKQLAELRNEWQRDI